jgi:hypothetical protein
MTRQSRTLSSKRPRDSYRVCVANLLRAELNGEDAGPPDAMATELYIGADGNLRNRRGILGKEYFVSVFLHPNFTTATAVNTVDSVAQLGRKWTNVRRRHSFAVVRVGGGDGGCCSGCVD